MSSVFFHTEQKRVETLENIETTIDYHPFPEGYPEAKGIFWRESFRPEDAFWSTLRTFLMATAEVPEMHFNPAL